MTVAFCTSLTQRIHQALVPALRAVLGPLDAWLAGLPLWAGRASAVTLFLVAGLWLLTLKREYVYLGAPDQARWRDLRLWAAFALLPYIVLYLTFK